MAIVNPSTTSSGGSLLEQVLAERDSMAKGRNPSAQPGAPIRGLIQNPKLAQESVGSNRVLAVKPLLNTEATSVIPPSNTSEIPSQPGIQAPALGGGVVGPNAFQEMPAPPGPAAPGGPEWRDPNPSSNSAPSSLPAAPPTSVNAPRGPVNPGRTPLSTSIFRAPTQSRLTGRIILASLPTKISPSINTRIGTWA